MLGLRRLSNRIGYHGKLVSLVAHQKYVTCFGLCTFATAGMFGDKNIRIK